ncbi:MAG: ABC transporter permease subunit [Oscillospiraceae bacterium]|nr:ABC transporter permease subunit [Oscillospiraceae bacterium]
MIAIMKRDLKGYFTSPLGFVFVAAYIIVMNATFYITSIMNASNGLTTVFNVMLYSLAIIVPILTMRTFSEDYKQKTDQLLLTSPVSPTGIVLGKFFAAFLVFVFGLVLTIIYVIICQAFGTVNMASVVGNYVAILGVAAVYISIGVFVSSLTENQLISAIATLAVFALLLILDLCYNLVNTAWIKSVLYWLSIYRRYNTFIMGVFSLADFVYYISVSAVFLFLTVRMLEKKRWS